MDTYCNWYGKATAKSTISGQNSLSFSFEGSLVFTVFLSKLVGPQGAGGPVIPQNSVAGRMTGHFDAQVSTPAKKVNGVGTAEWTAGGTYDPLEETIAVAIRSSGVDANGTETALERATQGAAPVERHFSTKLNWGSPTPVHNYWDPPVHHYWDPSAILDVMKPPTPPVIPSEREVDLYMVDSLPQTGLKDPERLVLDLKDPKSQTVTQTSEDEVGLGTRTSTWVFTLVPEFRIEREDRGMDGFNSFVSTDFISLHIAIPGMTLAESGWAGLASWEVKALGPFSENVVPNQVQHSATFGFQPKPGTRPINGSTARNRPMQYTVSAALGGIVQYSILTQDDADLLRQEYIDHKEDVVPTRGNCVARRIDHSFNAGNYNLVIDGGMQAALDKVTMEFGKESKCSVVVDSGFRSPQRNKATGDAHPGNPHVYGRALDLAPDPAGAETLKDLYEACVRAGYHSFCEAAPGKEVPPGSPDAKHVHIDW